MEQPLEPSTNASKEPQWIYYSGFALLVLSLLLFVIIGRLEGRQGNFSIFFIHYLIAVAYAIILLMNKSLGLLKSWSKVNIDKTFLLLNLFLVSAYSLNREIPVFEDSADWLCFYIIIASAATLSFRFQPIPQWLNASRLIILGSAILFYSYLSIYAANFYIIGAIGTLAIGIGAHIFVPLFLVIGVVILIKRSCSNVFTYCMVAVGSVATITAVILFIVVWNARILSIERKSNQSVLQTESDLPEWVTIGQTIQNDWLTQRILKSKLVYTISNDDFQVDFLPNTSWDEVRKHDPLVFLASFINKCSLADETRVKILESISDSRHRAQERLWSGDNLTTSYVVSDIDIYPELRLAYTEKYLNIKNNMVKQSWWRQTEEAIYTFQLSEGSVVTSLSLWINGKEEKSILTTKQKANEAYKTIVGVESRDPSVVHWQEGNTITARIFPCTKEEERKFKIGFTSPLPVKDGKVVYKNITFRGPNPEQAREAVRIRFIGNPDALQIPSGFEKNSKGDYFREQDYDPDLTITFAAVPVRSNQFSIDGYTYTLASYQPEMQAIQFSKIFLDLNNSWSKVEVEELKFLSTERDTYVYDGNEFIKLTQANWDELTSILINHNFSLFPFHLIKDLQASLVISKGEELSPHLTDFKESIFSQKISKFFAANHKVLLYNIDSRVSTYVSTFRELRGLEFAEGDIEQLKNLLQKNQFPKMEETDERIVLHDAQLVIQKTKADSASGPNTAPDHLARLFAYNHILRNVGANYFDNDFINDELVKTASMAYVVSPVSSLIVLETKEDYERFGIQDSDNSLKNASKQSSGAVPEPHEWAMIILFAGIVLYMTIKKYHPKAQY
jgi:XrtN system VIT domain protein